MEKKEDLKTDENKCFICNKNFGIMTRGKLCSVCGKIICKSHLVSKKDQPNLCYQCEILQIKSSRQKEIQKEIEKTQSAIKFSKEEYKKNNEERQENMKIVEEIEKVLIENEKNGNLKFEELNERFEAQFKKVENARAVYSKNSNELSLINAAENKMRIEIEEYERKIQELEKLQLDEKDEKQKLGHELEYEKKKLLAGLPKDKLESILCESCKGILDNRPLNPIIDEGFNED